ncbi:MAG: exodeoxyribonuclease VII small subunit [Bacteroidetes bacterium]|nr:exodeoxyribonuclease VII small subunit [Bacteroidota bacterium]
MKENKHTKTKDFIKEKITAIETISQELEENSLPLEYLVQRYEDGMNILQEVKQFINQIEGKLIDITEQQKKELL